MHEEQCAFPPLSRRTANGHFLVRGVFEQWSFSMEEVDFCSEVKK